MNDSIGWIVRLWCFSSSRCLFCTECSSTWESPRYPAFRLVSHRRRFCKQPI